jgi:hypothetical protein
MNMNRACVFSLLSAISIYGCGNSSVEHQGASPRYAPLRNPEAYAIYNEALKHCVASQKARTVSMVRYTTLDHLMTHCLETADKSTQLRSAVADLRSENSSAYGIEPKFDIPFTYELADEMEQIGGTRPAPPGMTQSDFLQQQIRKLEQRARAHFTQVQLSAPGISHDGRVAAVYIRISYAGKFLVLHKNGGMWSVDPHPLCWWIS